MTLEQTISTKEVCEKLKRVEEHMPKMPSFIYNVAHYFAERLERLDEISPPDFVLQYELMIYDLQTGVDSVTRNPVPSHLTRYPTQLYDVLSTYARLLATKVCPEDFAEGVRQFVDEVNTQKG